MNPDNTNIRLQEYNPTSKQMDDLGKVNVTTLARNIKPAQFGNLLADMLNVVGNQGSYADGVAATLVRQHRALQSAVIFFLIEVIVGFARHYRDAWKGNVDPRNDVAVKAADKLLELYNNNELFS